MSQRLLPLLKCNEKQRQEIDYYTFEFLDTPIKGAVNDFVGLELFHGSSHGLTG